eukprot:TRINITY_DN27398_c0_g1_i1.p2 TRINITY_DN27398_c0_g1~~TRINITY_DN27398_c0_g1_i1.p2  ORF type:complete len:108 (-),score=10.16 TRINITY_DN27398_c0_g1_i1:358-681(-)
MDFSTSRSSSEPNFFASGSLSRRPPQASYKPHNSAYGSFYRPGGRSERQIDMLPLNRLNHAPIKSSKEFTDKLTKCGFPVRGVLDTKITPETEKFRAGTRDWILRLN